MSEHAPSVAWTPDSLLAAGYQPCRRCGGWTRPGGVVCAHCHVPLTPATPTAPTPAATPGPKPGRKGRTRAGTNTSATRGRAAYGSLTEPIETVFYGIPQSQGSTRAVAPGVVTHSNATELAHWRDGITVHMRTLLGPTWIAPNAPLRLSCIFTVPPPADLPTKPVPADGWRDLDKLVRALGDALCPTSRFRTIASDMRITSYGIGPAKTYPAPHSTYPGALPAPGVWFRLEPEPADPTLWEPVWPDPATFPPPPH